MSNVVRTVGLSGTVYYEVSHMGTNLTLASDDKNKVIAQSGDIVESFSLANIDCSLTGIPTPLKLPVLELMSAYLMDVVFPE